ncbi:MAG TPA: hypothetical protein DET40_03565 [Lentisphaeria bacterium]|nr:MAG: hypothetical protein A2X45_23405 [Lentisphaerae bacterium GWF2_50_93]HCE42607.1 hypothetical protein [Lentisphaeria bacterium]
MKKLKLPVIKGKTECWPNKAICPICGKHKVFEPHSMAILSAGACLMNRKEKYGGPSNQMDGFMHISWHGAHDGGIGKDREIGCIVDIVKDVIGGQAELYFCSTQCLRKFFDSCVNELEKKIKKSRNFN